MSEQSNGKQNTAAAVDNRSEEQKEKDIKLRQILLYAGLGILVLTIAAMLIYGVAAKQTGTTFRAIIVIGMSAFWLLNDVISPIVTHAAAGKTGQQISIMRIMAVCDLIGYAGLAYFCFAMNSNTGFYGVLVYVVATVVKRRFQNDLDKPDEAEADQAASETEAEDNETVLGTAADRVERMEKAGRKLSIRELAALNTADMNDEVPSEEVLSEEETEDN